MSRDGRIKLQGSACSVSDDLERLQIAEVQREVVQAAYRFLLPALRDGDPGRRLAGHASPTCAGRGREPGRG